MTVTTACFLALALLVTVLLGYFFTVLVCSGRISNKLAWTLSPAIGTGLCSIIFFVFRRPMFKVELLTVVAMFAMWSRYRKRTISKGSLPDNRVPFLTLWIVGTLAWVTLASIIWIDRAPYGGWDGWAIWGAHARYLYRAGPVWPQYIRNTAHPDYPLLLPAA